MTATAEQLQPLAWLQYSGNTNQAVGAINTSVDLNWQNDRESFPNGLLVKQSLTAFRALRDCTVRVSTMVATDGSGNNQGCGLRAERNGTIIPWSGSKGFLRGNETECPSVVQHFLCDLDANQDLTIQFVNTDGGTNTAVDAITNLDGAVDGRTCLVEVVRLR